jgi:Zn-dependent protease with chaperone function
MLRVSAMFDNGDLQARSPDATLLAEQRVANVISEMAVAANLPPPRVLITEVGCNAAVFGRDEQHVTIVISHALLERLDRAEMQGIAAHLIGSVANGDMSIGLQAAATLSLFGFMTRLTTLLTNPGAWRPLARIFIALLSPTKASGRSLAEELADPFGAKDPEVPPKKNIDTSTLRGKIEQFRTMLWLPLAGSIVITGFFTGMVCLFLLGPLLSLVWRQRKYMADATAVRLTRDPNTLSEALEKMSGADSVIAPWAAHFSVTSRSGTRGLMSNSAVPMFPSLDRRLAALAKLGAHLTQAPKKMPLKFVLIATPLFVIVGVLAAIAMFLLAWVSIPLSALFLGIPFAIVHLLLRWIGGGS